MAIFLATVCRDAIEPRDIELIRDLSAWIDGLPSFRKTQFRWVRELEAKFSLDKEKKRKAKCLKLLEGDANVILLLLSRLTNKEQEAVYTKLTEFCESKLPGFDDSARLIHLPRLRCIRCGSAVHFVNKNCNNLNAVALIDIEKDITTIKRWLPAHLRRVVKHVRFGNVSRSTFKESIREESIFPQLMVFDLSALDRQTQKTTSKEIIDWAKKTIDEDDREAFRHNLGREEGYTGTQIVLPTARQFPSVVVLSGSLVRSDLPNSALDWVAKGAIISYCRRQ